MKRTVTAEHCDDRPKEIEIEDGDKVAFLCEKCKGLFDVDSEGNVTRSPLKNTTVVVRGVLYEIVKGQFVENGDTYKGKS